MLFTSRHRMPGGELLRPRLPDSRMCVVHNADRYRDPAVRAEYVAGFTLLLDPERNRDRTHLQRQRVAALAPRRCPGGQLPARAASAMGSTFCQHYVTIRHWRNTDLEASWLSVVRRAEGKTARYACWWQSCGLPR